MAKKRNYSDAFLKYDFVDIFSNGVQKPQCVICMKVLSAEFMKRSKLQRHLRTNYPHLQNKDLTFFERKSNSLKRSRMYTSGAFQQQHRAAVEVSFRVFLRIAKGKKPHTVAGELILPCAKDMN